MLPVAGVDPEAWPMPAGAAPLAQASDEAPACEIVGLNAQRANGRMIRFVPAEKVVHVQLNQMRRPTVLRFEQFRMLLLTQPLAVAATAPFAEFELVWTDGATTAGETLERRETPFGLFLF
ncbi:MAG: pilus assembly protein PilB, partial [Comamonadaceae bacterium]